MYTGTLVEFLNMGGGEIMLILAVVLLLFGGKKLPELARGLGKGLRDFKDASDGVKREIHRNINAAGINDEINDIKSTLTGDSPSRPHNYDYTPGEPTHSSDDKGNSAYNGDEAAHYNASGANDTPQSSTVENTTNAEDAGNSEQVKHADHNEHTQK